MLNWLKKTLGMHGLSNPDGVPPDVIEAMAQDLERVKRAGADFPARALRHIVDGTDNDVPAALVKAVVRHTVWTGGDLDQKGREVRWRIYDAWDQVSPAVLIRFGNVLSASSDSLSQQQRLMLAQKHPWVEALALDLLSIPVSHFVYTGTEVKPHRHASMSRLESLLEYAGEKREELVASTFRSAAPTNRWTPTPEYIRDMPGFGDSVRTHAEAVRTAFRVKSFEQRIYALKLLEHLDAAALAPFPEELAALTRDSSKKVRSLAAPIALRLGEAIFSLARRDAVEEKPEQRAFALRLLWESGDDEQRRFVSKRGEEDPAESVRKTVQLLQSGAEAGVKAAAGAAAELQVLDVKADLTTPLSDASRAALLKALEQINELIEQYRIQVEAQNKHWGAHWKTLPSSALRKIVAQTCEATQARGFETFNLTINAQLDKSMKLLRAWMAREDVKLTHVVRLLLSIGDITRQNRTDYYFGAASYGLLPQYGRTKPDASLLELAALLEEFDISSQSLVRDWYDRWRGGVTSGWPASAVWPFFAKHREAITMVFNPSSPYAGEYWFTKSRVFDALETFPEVPADLVPQLMELAFGGNKADRAGAQRVLERLPGKEDYIVQALTAGKAEGRISAANWLARLRYTEAIPHIEKALAKEKNDAAAGALMSALEALGVPVDRFLNREGLQKDAVRALAKGLPSDLTWFPFDGLPEVRWDDNNEIVPNETLRWLIVQSCKLKTPEPGGVLRRYCASFKTAGREALGTYTLVAWLREDVKPIARADAESQARAYAQQMIKWIKQAPQYYDDALKNATEDQLFESHLPNFLKQPAGTAIGSKGILAVVAACGGSEIAPLAQRYLKEYYGTRAAQGKALIQMLAWVEHPTATQLMLSIGSRFRTKGFQEEATKQAQLLAERKGWTLDELSDRTIPTAGFDEDGESVIDYGDRKFTARLSADFDVELYNADGKKIGSLPDARKDEDEAKVKELKKQFAAAKKEIKGVLQLQKDRLYEALCTQRCWKFEDWSLYLQRHPIVRRYCQQLVWLAMEDGKLTASFRPLDDGTLTDAADDTIAVSPQAQVMLAHDSNLQQSEAQAWLKHLEDYKVTPLFQQFGKGTYELPDDKKEATELDDFKGYVLDAFTLRGRTGKLGYTRGASEDGGWFYRYQKRFPTLGLEANIEFTGNGLPEENRKVALVSLWFERAEEQRSVGSGKVQLNEVPAVLLSECWNDIRVMAGDGAFDEQWEKKVRF